MKIVILSIFLLQTACLPLTAGSDLADDPRSAKAWLKTGIAAQLSKLPSVTFATNPNDKNIAAVNCQVRENWTGTFLVIHHVGDTVDWCAELPEIYLNSGEYVLTCKWVVLEKLQMTVLEVFTSTHMGNGSLWIFALEGRELRLLLNTQAVDRHHEHSSGGLAHVKSSAVFEGGQLSVNYRAPGGGNAEEVYLSGKLITLDDDDRVIATKPYSETWKWDSNKRVFTPDRSPKSAD